MKTSKYQKVRIKIRKREVGIGLTSFSHVVKIEQHKMCHINWIINI